MRSVYELNHPHIWGALLPEASPEHDLPAAKHHRKRSSMNQYKSLRASKRWDIWPQDLGMLKCVGYGNMEQRKLPCLMNMSPKNKGISLKNSNFRNNHCRFFSIKGTFKILFPPKEACTQNIDPKPPVIISGGYLHICSRSDMHSLQD